MLLQGLQTSYLYMLADTGGSDNVFQNAWNAVKTGASAAGNAVSNVVGGAVSGTGDFISEQFTSQMSTMICDAIVSTLKSIANDATSVTNGVTDAVAQTPSSFNGNINSLMHSLSNDVMIPIAGVILTFVLVYELIQMITEKNNMAEMDTFMLYKWIFKAAVCVVIVSHSWEIAQAFFDVGQWIVRTASGTINTTGNMNTQAAAAFLDSGEADTYLKQTYSLGSLLALWVESMLSMLAIRIITILIRVIVFIRMIEIFVYISVSPVPAATVGNRNWGQIGENYIRALAALAFQAFFIMVALGIYTELSTTVALDKNIVLSMGTILMYTVALALVVKQSKSLSFSIFNAH